MFDDAAEANLKAVIARYEKDGWTMSKPCSSFAADAWKAATGEGLHHTYSGQSNPTSLVEGIKNANHGKPFAIK